MTKTYSKRKFISILFIFCVFICLSCVAAQNPSDSTLTTPDSYADEIQQVSVDSNATEINSLNNGNNQLKANSAEYTFDTIQNEIDNANAGDIIYLNATTYTGSGCINIEKNITIIGVAESTILDAKGQSSLFYINANNVILSNITFINGKIRDNGAAIYWIGDNGHISGCNFVNNSVGWKGGALCWDGNNGSVSGCRFLNNSVSDDGSNECWGGAIYWNGTDGSISNCSFLNNSAYCGGAIYWDGNKGNVFNCSFEDNAAVTVFNQAEFTGRGGAVYWNGGNGGVLNCSFLKNEGDYAGAVFWNSDNGSVLNCSFENNTAEWEGGAIYWNANNGFVFKSSFVSNIVSSYHAQYGGAIYWNCGDGNVSDCNFVDNHADNGAGAIYWNSGSSSILNSNFTNNNAPNTGGAIYWGAVNVFAFNCSFISNYVNGGRDVYGGAIYCEGSGSVLNCSFMDNAAGDEAGAILWHNGNSFISYCSFSNNSASNGGGAIVQSHGEGNISDCSFVNNFGAKGSAIVCNNANSFISGCSFENNSYTSQGGAIYNYQSSSSVSGCNFVNNAASEGGAIFSGGDNNNYGDLQVSNCSFKNNSANGGGAIYWSGGSCSVFNSSFVNNSVGEKGSAIYCNPGASSMFLAFNCSFVNNSANCSAVYCDNGDCYVSNCSFKENSATDDCSCVYIEVGSCNVNNSTFIDNSASGDGGAVYCSYSSGDVLNCSFIYNSAKSIIYAEGDSHVQINNNIFLRNKIDSNIDCGHGGDFNADYNWFGHNATNYAQDPEVAEYLINNWLFLNATANPNEFTIFNSSEITFDLFVYDKNSASSQKYGSNLLQSINLTITSSKGVVNKNTANIGDSIIFTPEGKGMGSVTATIVGIQDAIELKIEEDANFNATLDSNEAFYGENISMSLNYNPNATGTVNITFNGKKHNATVAEINLNETILVPLFVVPDEYVVSVTYSGDDNFIKGAVTLPDTLTVKKLNSNVEAVPHDIYYNNFMEDVLFTFILPENATGNLSININSADSTIDVAEKGRKDNGTLIVDFRPDVKPAGKYNLSVTYSGDDFYKNSSANSSANILPVITEIWMEFNATTLFLNDKLVIDDYYVYYIHPSSSHGKTEITSSDFNVAYINQDTKELEGRSLGNATVSINFYGDGNYTDASGSFVVNVIKAYSKVTIDPINNVVYGNNVTVYYSIENRTDNVSITVKTLDGSSEVPQSKLIIGNDTVIIMGLNAGDYSISIVNNEDGKTSGNESVGLFSVTKIQPKLTLDVSNVTYGETEVITIISDTPGSVNVTVNNVTQTLELDDNLSAKLTLNNLIGGNCHITVVYNGNNNFESVNATNEFIVNCLNTTLSFDTKSIDKNVQIVVSFKDDATGNVTILVDGDYFISAIDKGKAVFNVPDLYGGNHYIEINYEGDSKYNPIKLDSSFNLTLSTKIIANNVNKIYNIGANLVIGLKDEHDNALANRNISIMINNVLKNLKTDLNGQCYFAINNLAPKNYYEATIAFNGETYNTKISKIVKIVVKKATPKLTAKSKTFKVKTKTKKYTVTLKNNLNKAMKNVKVIIKVNKRTYSAKTNSKGAATFKLSKLTKKGKFTALVKSAGGKYYNAKTVKTKITIK